MKKNIIIPTIILVLLLFIWVFQWQTTASKSLNARVVKWQKNIITGEQRAKEYYYDKIKTTKLKQEEDYTILYYTLLGGTSITLIWQSIKNKKALK